jgi:acetyl-CoA C-acetyltransferase
MMLEAMQLAPAGGAIALGQEGAWAFGGKVVVSPSGGVMCSNPISVTALVRVAEVAQQVRGRAGGQQVGGARTGLATGAGGDSQFYGVAVVSGDDPRI